MYAITLRHPWPWAICCCGKRIENRTWAPALSIGEKFAIHGGRWPIGEDGKTHGQVDADYVEDIIESVKELKAAGLIPVPKVTLRDLSRYAGIVAVATFGGTTRMSNSPWFSGPVGWNLDDVVVLPKPVACRGSQGLWLVSGEALDAMRMQFKGAA